MSDSGYGIAIVGMAGRFPGANGIEEFWDRVCSTDDAITRWEPEVPAEVGAGGILSLIEYFDADYFGYSPHEAILIDPQHRVLLETCVDAICDAGHEAAPWSSTGVFASCGPNTYILDLLKERRGSSASAELYRVLLGNDKDFLSTRVAFKLGLRGPALTVQTACSSSLVAVHLACQALLSGECDAALVGGVSVRVPQELAYHAHEGGVLSAMGRCAPFDSSADGTVPGSGVGAVVLRRLEDCTPDESIYAVILGSAINNDGSQKVTFTAPSAPSQAEVIAEALAVSSVPGDAVGLIEAHGTGTRLGDPIEFEALARALGPRASGREFCRLTAVKGSVGHLDAAAGITGLIKAALALQREVMPGLCNFKVPNPDLALLAADCPLTLDSETKAWPNGTRRRVAGVSSFGIGGTNAHVVLGEADGLGVVRSDAPRARAWDRIRCWPESPRDEARLDSTDRRRRVTAGISDSTVEIEKALRECWSAATGMPAGTIPLDTSYIDLGIDSLTLLGILERFSSATGVRLPDDDLTQLATLRSQMALAWQMIDSAREGTASPQESEINASPRFRGSLIVPMARRALSDAAAVLVHPGGGTVLGYLDLANRLFANVVLGIQSPSHAERRELAHIEDAASVYLDELEGQWDSGSALLCGWSYGGAVALEMAAQLEASGRTVGLVAMLDSHPPSAYASLEQESGAQAATLAGFLGVLAMYLGKEGGGRDAWLSDMTRRSIEGESLSALIDEILTLDGVPSWATRHDILRLFDAWTLHFAALRAWNGPSRPVSCEVVLFAASRVQSNAMQERLGIRLPVDPESAWSEHVHRLSCVKVDADHYSIVKRGPASVIANALNTIWADARAVNDETI